MTPRDYWSAWQRLTPAERRATLGALLLLPAVAAATRVIRLPRILRWSESTASLDRDLTADQLVRAVARAARYGPYAGNCLSQSLVLMRLLRRSGIESTLRLGARTGDGTMEAHAWVETDGVVLNDGPDVAARFAPFPHPAEPGRVRW